MKFGEGTTKNLTGFKSLSQLEIRSKSRESLRKNSSTVKVELSKMSRKSLIPKKFDENVVFA
jgi:hypothetical protein